MGKKWDNCKQDVPGGALIKDEKITEGGVRVKVTEGDEVKE